MKALHDITPLYFRYITLRKWGLLFNRAGQIIACDAGKEGTKCALEKRSLEHLFFSFRGS
jgi:hypothetical protein